MNPTSSPKAKATKSDHSNLTVVMVRLRPRHRRLPLVVVVLVLVVVMARKVPRDLRDLASIRRHGRTELWGEDGPVEFFHADAAAAADTLSNSKSNDSKKRVG